ncbi:transporter substrate-binding domain-containing protein [uncultured Paraglaciecola sp.]|uniref:substrate-binding periplasmic protein n=1 Tax=uncultured Paraglaciecola sp. TaxID=1765024 RepID=UPI0030D7391A|tara:strand:- start:173145 stop:173873 length:729 start_codon:yes stop_codon:yes gene_type:complete
MRLYVLVFTLLLTFFPVAVWGQEIIRSSVSEEFLDGLQAKYLRNIAKRMNMPIEIIPMPFARRIKEFRQGNLDILVGLNREDDRQDEVLYITPSYEALRHTFFIKKENKHKLQSFNDLKKLSIGVTRHAKYFKKFNQESNLIMVPVSRLRQKIELLIKDRINTFVHFEESAMSRISVMELQNEIVIADYQPIEVDYYYVTISRNSTLIHKKPQFEAAVRAAIANQEFATIRREHYAALADSL